ncbi:XdhC/CoxI family protein [Bacillus timonensis]|uniref:XdhC/CoxI family protein n=1 Tax=Bacillus timonensis TaxID=1033734 RepID=A0A4S3PT17_9BACI|nr:XdhC/CoxI family protein [Bacillus timonensis]THE12738.1 XdhC/CoxI family protein [Bacillus timonensis]
MIDIFQVMEQAIRSTQPSVMATIIHVEGSAYLKEGTSMLFFEDGKKCGSMSPGCIEEDLSYRVKEVFKDGKSQTIVYDSTVEDDLMWGQEIGCGGVIYILLVMVDDSLKENLKRVRDQLKSGKKVLHVIKFSSNFTVEFSGYRTEIGELIGDKRIESLENSNWPTKSGLINLVYYHTYIPRKRLIIFGAGPDIEPLVELAVKIGFSVIVCDWRESLCNRNHFPQAHDFIIGFPNEVLQKLTFTHEDFVVLMTHNLKRDKEIVSYLLKKQLRYVGILGSKNRINLLFGQTSKPPWVSAPVGLPIGGQGATEIAISILAEMILVMRGEKVGEGAIYESGGHIPSSRKEQSNGKE